MTDNDRTKNADYVELLSFKIDGNDYSLDIKKVIEIRGWSGAEPMPNAPYYVRGVINLRGKVLPVVDLSVRLGMKSVDDDTRNVVIVVQSENLTVGLLVEAVSDILSLPQQDLQQPPEIAIETGPNFVSGLTVVEDRMIRVLNLAELLPADLKLAA